MPDDAAPPKTREIPAADGDCLPLLTAPTPGAAAAALLAELRLLLRAAAAPSPPDLAADRLREAERVAERLAALAAAPAAAAVAAAIAARVQAEPSGGWPLHRTARRLDATLALTADHRLAWERAMTRRDWDAAEAMAETMEAGPVSAAAWIAAAAARLAELAALVAELTEPLARDGQLASGGVAAAGLLLDDLAVIAERLETQP